MAVRLKASARTSAEDLLAMQLTAAGIDFNRQYQYARDIGRRFAADFAVWGADPPRLGMRRDCFLVEVQGGVFSGRAHGSIQGILMDNERLNIAALLRFHVLRFVPDQVESGEALNVIQQALGVK